MIGLINQFGFVKINEEYIFVKSYLKSIDWFYEKYRLLI